MPVISFIIPAFNAAPYIKDCLDSVYALDLQECGREVIVVNDGSTDDTGHLLEIYGRDKELVIINQGNEGLSAARNSGLDKASGEYICFVDADDRLLPSSLDDILHYMRQGIDIIGVDLVERLLNGNKHPYRRYVPQYNKTYRRAEEFMRGRNLMPCAVAYLYRREFLNAEYLRFLPGIYHEDEEFTPRAFAAADSFVATNTTLYERILREESITTTTDKAIQKQKFHDLLFILRRLDGMRVESMQCKLDWLAVDILRLLLRQHHDNLFVNEIVTGLRVLGYFPLRWHWSLKYILLVFYTRVKFRCIY